jgi:hypothetical protein
VDKTKTRHLLIIFKLATPKGNQYALGNDGVRPSKYEDKTPEEWKDLIQGYIDSCKDEYRDNGKIVVHLPKIEGLALALTISRETIYAWAKEHKEFSDTLEKISAKQKESLIDKGLANEYNPTIAKLLLAANHGMSDSIKTEGDQKLDITITNYAKNSPAI